MTPGAEDRFDTAPTDTVVVAGDTGEWPEGVTLDDISHRRQEPGPDERTPMEAEHVCVPLHRPPEYRGDGVVTMSEAEIATVWAAMPEDIREAERDLRTEQRKPIPPILQS